MSQLRQDTLTGRWVIMAAGRQGRPNEFALAPASSTDKDDCPFCPRHEDRTTPEIMATGRDGTKDRSRWRVRVFPNMYPALGLPESEGQEATQAEYSETVPGQGIPAMDLFPAEPGQGGHEVVAYTPDHEGSLGSLNRDHLTELLVVIRDRLTALEQSVPQVLHVLPFCNHGPQAGATLAHPHLQILAAPLIPALVRDKAANLAEYLRRTGRCLLCDTLEAELRDGRRVIAQNSSWVALAPWASCFSYEMRFVPQTHESRISDSSIENLADLAQILKWALERLEKIHQNLSYNLIIHSGAARGDGTAGGDAAASPSFHWHVEVLPRLSRLAGFEAGTGYAMNSITPEAAAARLRGEG